MSQDNPTKKPSRHTRSRNNKKRRLEEEKLKTQELEISGFASYSQLSNITIPTECSIPLPSTTRNIIFNPNQNRTQFATRGLCSLDKIHYIENEWRSVPISPSDCITSKGVKIQEEISTKDLLIETLIREARSTNRIEISEIPPDFLMLVDNEIVKIDPVDERNHQSHDLNKRLWVAFGRWLGMEEPIVRREVRRHLRSKWMNLSHAIDVQNHKKIQKAFDITTTRILRKEKAQLILSARGDLDSLKKIVYLRYIKESEYITDDNGKTLVHLENINNQTAVTQATDAVNRYYFHTLEHPSHRSDEFWTNFIEHFGVYARNNLLPYTSSNTASAHNVEHQECVDTLLRCLGPLSISVNEFVREYYGELYSKLEKLSWGVFGPKPFGVFPMIAINFNTISDYHWDEHDEPNSLCCLVALGDFEGGELCFPQLQIIVPLRSGQVVAFSSRLLLHGNFPITRGIRHSIVYFVHSMFFHHLRNFSSIYTDLENGIERDAYGSIVSMIPRQDLNDARNPNNLISPPNRKKVEPSCPTRLVIKDEEISI